MGLTLSVPLIASEAVQPVTKEEIASISSSFGKGLLIGAGAIGIGAIFYYRAIGPHNGIIDEEVFQEDLVLSRAKHTLCYWVGSLGIAAVSSVAFSQLPGAMVQMKTLRLAVRLESVCTVTIASLFSGVWVQGLPYKPEFNMKHIAWIIHSALVGAVMCPVLLMEKIVLAKAAGLTLLLFGEFAFLAICAHHITFLSLGLLVPLGTMCLVLATMGSYIWMPTSLAGVIFHSFIVHGGFIIVSIHILYDTQVVAAYALWCNREGSVVFDPINASMDLFMDTVKVFLRVAAIFCLMSAAVSDPKSG